MHISVVGHCIDSSNPDGPLGLSGASLLCSNGNYVNMKLDLLGPLDPGAVVRDVQIVQDVGRVVLSEHFVNIQQAFKDTGFPWAKGNGKTVLFALRVKDDNALQLLADSACI